MHQRVMVVSVCVCVGRWVGEGGRAGEVCVCVCVCTYVCHHISSDIAHLYVRYNNDTEKLRAVCSRVL